MNKETQQKADPKIAIWGNMNNMGFSLLRYFRDLGADAYLFPFSNDGQGPSAHFAPEADTWEFDRWKSYITDLSFPDAQVSALDAPHSWALAAKSLMRNLVWRDGKRLTSVSRHEIRKLVQGFDLILGSGIAPAVLQRVGRPLDIFAPYANQIEYLSSFDFERAHPKSSIFATHVNRIVRQRQIDGVRSARRIVSFEQELNGRVLRQLGRTAEALAIPMVYVDQALPNAAPSRHLAEIYDRIKASEYAVLHHARLLWSKPEHLTDAQWRLESKNSHWIFHAFSDLLRLRPGSRPLLIVVEYGPDVTKSKQLCASLGISDHVLWLPIMPRREAMWLLTKVDVGIGEFYDSHAMIWGGTGWEVMAMSRPLIQGFHFGHGEFEASFGCTEPPFLKVRNKEDVTRHLVAMMDDRLEGTRIGKACRAWFDAHNGRHLARQWLHLLTT
ncbi:MAG: hypothetical protein ACKO1N_07055 [Erythrobacter sp.]